MSFFVTSSLLTSAPLESGGPFPDVSQNFSFPYEAKAATEIPASHRPHLVKFLQYVIALDIDILPSAWDEHAATLAGLPAHDGGTSNVKQSLVNVDTALVYKRFRHAVPPDFATRYGTNSAESRFREMQFDAMITEITILTHLPKIYDSGFVHLMGICFEPSPLGLDVWPVCVLLRASHGDLATSVFSQPIWSRINTDSTIKLCAVIAQAIYKLHQCGVTHCDINPRNTLFWLDDQTGNGGIILSDFGFSYYSSKNKFVRLPRSEPWDAPEWNEREFTIEGATKSDIYAFGLMCFWLLFRYSTLGELGFPEMTVQEAFTCSRSEVISAIQERKRKGGILQWALSLLEATPDLDDVARSQIRDIFNFTLAQNPMNRTSSLEPLLRLLDSRLLHLESEDNPQSETTLSGQLAQPEQGPSSSSRSETISPSLVKEPDWHDSLGTPSLIFVMDVCDFRVHNSLVMCLRRILKDANCDRCKTHAAFQLSLFHRLGLGPEPSGEEGEGWHCESRLTEAELDEVIQQLKVSKKDNRSVTELIRLGLRTDPAGRYRQDGVLGEAERYYHRVCAMRELTLGRVHQSTLNNYHALAEVLMRQEKYEEAFEVAKKMTGLEGATNPQRIAVNSLLARLWAKLGDSEQAKTVLGGLVNHYRHSNGLQDSEELDHQLDLVNIALDQATRSSEALSTTLQVLNDCLTRLGPGHTTTIRAKGYLAIAYEANGEYTKAVELNEQLTAPLNDPDLNSDESRVLIQQLARLRIQYYILGRQDNAKECYSRFKRFVAGKKNVEEITSLAVDAINNSAVSLINQGDVARARVILEGLLSEASKRLDEERSTEITTVMGNLSYVCGMQDEKEREELLGRKVVDLRCIQLGPRHSHTVIAMGNLRQTLLSRGNIEDAMKFANLELEAVRNLPSEKYIEAVRLVAGTFEAVGAVHEAISFLEPEIAAQERQNISLSASLLGIMVLETICYVKIGNLPKARELMARCLPSIQRMEMSQGKLADDLTRLRTLWAEFNFAIDAEKTSQSMATLKAKA